MNIDEAMLTEILAEVVGAERKRADERVEAALAPLRNELLQLKSSALATRVGVTTAESLAALIN